MTYIPPKDWNKRLLADYFPSKPPLQNEARTRLKDALVAGDIHLIALNECYCGGREFIEIGNHDRFGLDFHAKLCLSCGLILTVPRLAEESLPVYYSRHYHQLMFGQLSGTTALFSPQQGRLIFERLWAHDPAKIKNTARVLEIGAGLGNVLKEFGDSARKKGFVPHLMATEYSLECLSAIRGLGIEAVEGDCLEALAAFGGPYDIIILSHVLEHITNLDGFMAGLKRLISPKTLIYIEVPGILTLHAKPEYNFDFRLYFVHAHTVHYNLETLKYHMSRFGLSCLAGDEIAYGIFINNDHPSLPRPKWLADYVLFYLANMEMTYHISVKIAQRLRRAESQAKKAAKVTNSHSWHLPALLRNLGKLVKPKGKNI